MEDSGSVTGSARLYGSGVVHQVPLPKTSLRDRSHLTAGACADGQTAGAGLRRLLLGDATIRAKPLPELANLIPYRRDVPGARCPAHHRLDSRTRLAEILLQRLKRRQSSLKAGDGVPATGPGRPVGRAAQVVTESLQLLIKLPGSGMPPPAPVLPPVRYKTLSARRKWGRSALQRCLYRFTDHGKCHILLE